MVCTDTLSQVFSAEARGKFITQLPATRTPRPTGNHAQVSNTLTTHTPDLPIVPAWLGWR